jgi:hypothetical protein
MRALPQFAKPRYESQSSSKELVANNKTLL